MLSTILLYKFPIAGPSKYNITTTMILARIRIKAYSTKPWPFSFKLNNMMNPPLLAGMLR